MSGRDIIFVDVNTIWHRRLAIALGEQTRVIGLAPRSGFGVPGRPKSSDGIEVVDTPLPPGWASRSAIVGQRLLARQIRKIAASLGNPVLILTSPAYEPLSRYLAGSLPIVTYTADDYGSYEGWRDARLHERKMQKRASLCVFVSEALQKRAVEDDGLPPAKTFVSPNGTEARFNASHDGAEMSKSSDYDRPIVGVLGALSDRLDLDFLGRVARLDAVGTFLIAGPVGAGVDPDHPVLTSPKTRVTGRLPHEDMHQYALAMDAALIPYAETPLNRFCSPMRLFDHLASGAAIYALPTCDQVQNIDAPGLVVGDENQLLEAMSQGIAEKKISRADMPIYWNDRAKTLLEAIDPVRLEADNSGP